MTHPLNHHIQSPHFDESLDVYQLPNLGCDVVMSEYHSGEPFPKNQLDAPFKMLVVHGEVSLTRQTSSSAETYQSGEWFEIAAHTPFNLTFTKDTHCVEIWFS